VTHLAPEEIRIASLIQGMESDVVHKLIGDHGGLFVLLGMRSRMHRGNTHDHIDLGLGIDLPYSFHGEPVSKEEIIHNQEIGQDAPPSRYVHAHEMAESREFKELIDGDPELNPIPKLLHHGFGIVGKEFGYPTVFELPVPILQSERQIQMEQGDKGGNVMFEEFIGEPAVKIELPLIDEPLAFRKDPRC
jgi:hypothetical protein